MRLYRYLTGPEDATFCHRVSEALSNGWELHGSPALSFNAATGEMVCGQAVVKEVPGVTYSPELTLGEY